jgi:hypothetical protein
LINALLRKEVRRRQKDNYRSKEEKGFQIHEFKWKEEMAKTDPVLMDFSLKLSLNDAAVKAKGKNQVGNSGADFMDLSYNAERRKLRVCYAIAVMIFAINPEAKHPFHLMLADVVEALGGRISLLKVLNQLGACALNRYTETVGTTIMEEGPFAQLPPDCEPCFITCSIDNADKTAATTLRRFGKPVADMHVVTVKIHRKPSIKLPESARGQDESRRQTGNAPVVG